MLVLNAFYFLSETSSWDAVYPILFLVIFLFIFVVFIIRIRGRQLKKWGSNKWYGFKELYNDHKKGMNEDMELWVVDKAFKKSLYVFWGINDASVNLAKSIKKHKKISKSQLVFVTTLSEYESGYKNGLLDVDGILLFSERCLIDIQKEIDINDNIQCNYFNEIGLDELGNQCKESKRVSFFFLSEDSVRNVQEMVILKNYFMNQENVLKNKEKTHLYCRARRNNHNIIYEEQSYLLDENEQKVKVHIVDDSNLAVLGLKMNEAYHPVQYVKVNEKAQVVSPFNAMILGFGQTGEDALRFLYEYGAFTGLGDNNEERSPLHITIVDRNMDNIKGSFLAKVPSLSRDYNANRTEFRQWDVHSMDFWNDLIEKIQSLNYIVIALGNDEENIAMAIDIYKLCLKYRYHEFKISNKNMPPTFSIFVRVYKNEYQQEFDIIRRHLNLFNTPDDLDILTMDYIFPFGSIRDIYTYDMIVNERTRKEAMTFAYVYDSKNKVDLTQKWERADEIKAEKVWDKKHTAKMLKELIDMRRQEEQDLSNSWHIGTKLALIEKAGVLPETRDVWPSKREGETLIYDVPPEQQEILDNIACCEHLRWNALCELQGYEPYWGPNTKMGKTELGFRKLHFCLRPWKISWTNDPQGKDTMTKGESYIQDKLKYDYNTIDTSIYVEKIRRRKM